MLYEDPGEEYVLEVGPDGRGTDNPLVDPRIRKEARLKVGALLHALRGLMGEVILAELAKGSVLGVELAQHQMWFHIRDWLFPESAQYMHEEGVGRHYWGDDERLLLDI